MERTFCQSCGMPLTEEILGTDADGSKTSDYCVYCFKDGAFTGDFTMAEMVEFCAQFVDQFNKDSGQNLSKEAYKDMLRQIYPNLKRWKLPADELPHATSPIKQQLIEEVNALGIKDMPVIDNLFILQGAFVNQAYHSIVMRPVTRFTTELRTPGSLRVTRSTAPEHAAQCMPPIS